MPNYLKLCFSFIMLIGAVNSCKSQSSNKIIIPPKECIELNNKGMKCLMDYPMYGKKGLDSAIDLLNEAVKCDTTYFIAYSNLAIAYDRKKDYNDEMFALNKMLSLTNNDPTYLVLKGMVFERMDKIDSANKTYQLAKIVFQKKLTEHPTATLVNGIVLLTALTEGKDEAMKELNKQIKLHPELSSKLSYLSDFIKILTDILLFMNCLLKNHQMLL